MKFNWDFILSKRLKMNFEKYKYKMKDPENSYFQGLSFYISKVNLLQGSQFGMQR